MSTLDNLSVLNTYSKYLLPQYNPFPMGRYVSVVVIRKTETETIFRTEGSGEGLVKESVIAGVEHTRSMRRVVISKRKQTAVERRTGREVLREHKMLKTAGKGEQPCALNTNAPCGKCIDCMLYGYAVGGGGAQKSRVMTEDAYSIGPVAQVTDSRTFNATYDNGTMRNPATGEASTSINEDEFVHAETHFLDIETLKDVTLGELQYVLANILRSSRYGAISSRMGKIQNTIAAMVFSDTEIFSNLELTQVVYDELMNGNSELDFPLSDGAVFQAVQNATQQLLQQVVGRVLVMPQQEIQQMRAETIALYRESDNVQAFLAEVEKGYAPASK